MKEWWVYLIYGGDELLYVGYTGGLDRRLHDHQGMTWWPAQAEVHLHGPYATKEEAMDQERWCIKRFDPKLNRSDAWRALKAPHHVPSKYKGVKQSEWPGRQKKTRGTGLDQT